MRRGRIGLFAVALALLAALLWHGRAAPTPSGDGEQSVFQPPLPLTEPTLLAAGSPDGSLGWPAQHASQSPVWVRLNDGGVVGRIDQRGRVLLAGEGVQATVLVWQPGEPQALETEADGRFRFERFSADEVALWAEKGTLRSAYRWVSPQSSGGELVLDLVGVLPVEGKVMSESGAPVFRAMVSIYGTDLTTTTDDAGAFRLASVPGGRWRIEVEHDDFLAQNQWIEVDGRGPGLVFVLRALATIAGTIVDDQGRPALGATLQVEGDEVEVDDGGEFSTTVRRRSVLLIARGEAGFATAAVSAPNPNVRMQLARGCALDVEVTLDREPLEGVVLTMGPVGVDTAKQDDAVSDRDGTARLGPVACGAVRLNAKFQGRELEPTRYLSLAAPLAPLMLDVQAKRTLKVQTFDAFFGVVIGDLSITVEGDGAKLVAKTDATGRVRFVGLPGGELTVSTRFARGPRVSTRVTVEREVELRAPHPRRVTGRAVGDQGEGLNELIIDDETVHTEQGAFAAWVDPQATGIDISSMSHLQKTVPIVAGPNELDVGTVTLSRRGELHVHVLLPDGRPAPGARLVWVGLDDPWIDSSQRQEATEATDARGEYVSSTSARRICPRAFAAGYAPSSRAGCPFEVPPGRRKDLELRLLAPAWVKGASAPGSGQTIAYDDAEEYSVVVKEPEPFLLGPLSPGSHKVLVWTRALTAQQRVVELAEGETKDFDTGVHARVHVRVRSGAPFQVAGAYEGTAPISGRLPVEIADLVARNGESVATLSGLGAGPWTIVIARPADNTRRQQQITLEATGELEVVFDVP